MAHVGKRGLVLCVAAAAAACSAAGEPARVGIAMDLTAPRGLLDGVTALSLHVYEGSVACDGPTGVTSFPDGEDGATEIATVDLGTTGCAATAQFCGDVTIAKSEATRVFEAVAKDGDETLAIGCAAATITQDAVPVAITMVRYLAPAQCNDGTIQPTEQCEPGGTPICDDGCQSNELLLSVGSTQNGTRDGAPGDKTDPVFLWPAQSGAQGRLFAFYTDRAVPSGESNVDVGLRAMSDDLSPLDSPPALAAGEIFLPNGSSFPPSASPRAQTAPSAAFVRGKYYVVFQDDDTAGANGIDVHLRSMDSALVAEQGAAPLGVNGAGGAGEPNIQAAPSVAAGPNDQLFIAWEDQGQGKIVGRTFAAPNTLGNQNDLSTGTGNRDVSVAATPKGWVAVWQSGTGIKLRALNEDGTPQGAEQAVDDAGGGTHPGVASLADGRFAVTWSAGGDVFVQRYDDKGAKIPGDQGSPLNDVVTDGDQIEPAIGAMTAAGGSYAVAWLDAASGHIRARLLGGTEGFLFNNVNGQATEFAASRADGRERGAPTVASGGSGPFLAIGWEDKTEPAGIVVRRFPLPSP